VEERLIRKKGGSRSPSPKRGRKLREGAKVQARYRMGASVEISFDCLLICFIQAGDRSTIRGASNATAATGPTTYTVTRHSVYALDAPRLTICPHTDDDGEKETRVLEEYIKAEDAGSSDEERKRDDGDRGRGRMRVGDRIEARYRGP
jgi:hypothetical protein